MRVKNDVIRRWFWAFENDTAAFRAALHPEIEWFPFDENRGRLYSIEAALRNRNEWLETWDEHRFEVEEVAAERRQRRRLGPHNRPRKDQRSRG